MAKHIWTGVGIAVGIALWPVVLPVLVIGLIASAFKGAADRQPKQTVEPILGDLRAEQLAIVQQRNREYFESIYRKS